MRAKLFFALLFVSLLWAGTAALGQKIAVERPALPRAALERCILPQREKTEPAGQSAARHVPASQAAQPCRPSLCRRPAITARPIRRFT